MLDFTFQLRVIAGKKLLKQFTERICQVHIKFIKFHKICNLHVAILKISLYHLYSCSNSSTYNLNIVNYTSSEAGVYEYVIQLQHINYKYTFLETTSHKMQTNMLFQQFNRPLSDKSKLMFNWMFCFHW